MWFTVAKYKEILFLDDICPYFVAQATDFLGMNLIVVTFMM
jgi:hypothetical protein